VLGGDYSVDVYVDTTSGGQDAARCPAWAPVSVYSAHAFVPNHTLAPYDLIVYQVGNATWHDYLWPYLVRYPGLVVLHDAALHHARARVLLSHGRRHDYRAEFAYAHPGAPRDLAEFAVAGFPGVVYYLWPHRRIAIESARLVAVHSQALADSLQDEYPDTPVRGIRMGVPAPGEAASAGSSGPTFACYGRVTPEKRISQVLSAFREAVAAVPTARLMLVGEVADYYELQGDIDRWGLGERVAVTGFVPDDALDEWVAAADVCVCLRWPTTQETSASWIRCLAAGKPTVITDLAHTTEVPALDPRTWAPAHPQPSTPTPPVAVSIDILD
jgi:glycosyltransferase involved in cell wall biosynthesis